MTRINSTKQYDFEKFKNYLANKYIATCGDGITQLMNNLKPVVSVHESKEGMISVLDNLIKVIPGPETCPNLDGIAQPNIDFKKVCQMFSVSKTRLK